MKRLKLDRNKMRGAQRALNFLRIERESGPHPAAVALQRRPLQALADRRVMRFTAIAKGRNN